MEGDILTLPQGGSNRREVELEVVKTEVTSNEVKSAVNAVKELQHKGKHVTNSRRQDIRR
ncbi:hypothetical protein [Sulfuracidifex tepidarius]|uniref:Uncharacterized protein n=1 Tax=Sulfuracidifex tepidarius TaxID=1294262 RepID=A0A510DT20_9CREN|nr:hypothetical protein [Sulfuracidifex tepidarius]BBG23311.1 hypothetical protein IC006_0595 [Sulfuracidifex tepidarius]BBG26061.1 hypothetical protein IC007_0566 [Sulfuracidifex tepidarius]